MPSADHHAGQMDPRNIALERIRIQRRLAAFRVKPHAQAFNEREIGMVAGEREHPSRRQSLFAGPILYKNFFIGDPLHARLEQRFHLARLDAVLNVRPDPILDRCTKFLVPVHQRHARSVSIQVERRFRGRILPADHNHILIPIFVRLAVVMRYMREVFPWHAQLVRQIVVSCRHGDLSAPVPLFRSLLRFRYYCEVFILAINPHHQLVQP